MHTYHRISEVCVCDLAPECAIVYICTLCRGLRLLPRARYSGSARGGMQHLAPSGTTPPRPPTPSRPTHPAPPYPPNTPHVCTLPLLLDLSAEYRRSGGMQRSSTCTQRSYEVMRVPASYSVDLDDALIVQVMTPSGIFHTTMRSDSFFRMQGLCFSSLQCQSISD